MSPLLRFILLGGLLFAVFGGDSRTPEHPPPLERGVSDEDVLFREALARGYHRSDAIVRRRLARNLRFARGDGSSGDRADFETALVDESIALGMHETDLVVRRRLVQKMRLGVAAGARAQEPGDGQLLGYLDAHPERFTRAARIRLSQIFFHDPARAAAARSVQASRAADGDALLLPRDLPWLSRADLAGELGPGFAAAVWELAEGTWHGPVASAYGFHLVRVHARRPEELASLSSVRSAVREALLEERTSRALARRIAELRGDAGQDQDDPS